MSEIRGRYEVLGVRGPHWLLVALDREHNRPVTLQITPAETERQRQALRTRTQELLALRPHPGLPVIRDALLDGRRHVLVTDRPAGPTLEEVLEERGRLPRSETLELMTHLADALEHLHGHHPPVAHGALWPGGIVVADDGRPVPVTFGLPGQEPPVPYRPPEGGSSLAGDVFSLGTMARDLLARAPGIERWEGLGRIGAAVIERLLGRCLDGDPAQRPRSARGFVGELRGRLEGTLPSGTVTVLMTDIEGSTRLWEDNPEGMRLAIAGHDAAMAQVIERHGGRLPRDQGEGDSTLSAFPVAADAVACALAAQRALAGASRSTRTPLRVRMAIHTGQMHPQEGNYRGSEVNRCARLRSVAHGGQILLSSATAALLRGNLPPGARLKDLGLHRLKDVPDPEHVFGVLHPELPADFPPLRSMGRIEPSAAQAGQLVGRDEEIERLVAALDDAMAGRARLSFVVGEAGIGKSRLCGELAGHARSRHAHVLWGRCHEQEGAPPYWPWVQVVRSYASQRSPDELSSEMGQGAVDIAQVVPEVAEALPGLPSPPHVEPASARFRLFDSMTSFLRSASRERPLVLVLDDLHWADTPSLLLLEFLARELAQARVLILAAFRQPSPGDPLSQSLGDLSRQPITERIDLAGLTERQVARLVEMTAGVDPSAALIERVHRLSEGNPFYLNEIVRLLQEQGRLGADTSVEEIEVPPSVREVVSRRLASLPPGSREALAAASVVGRESSADLVAEIIGVPTDDILERLDDAARAGILAEDRARPGGYAFTHALIKEALYEGLPSPTRARLHLETGRALERRLGPDPGTRAADLAYHFGQAAPLGTQAEALRYFRRAAEVAMSRLAYEKAARHYGEALRMAEAEGATSDSGRCDLLLAYGIALWHSAAVSAAKEALQRAAAIARSLGDGHRLARAALGYGDLWIEVGVVDRVAVTLLEEAMGSVSKDDPLRVDLGARLAMELSSSPGAVDRRAALSAEAVDSARRTGDRRSLAYALLARRHALWGPDHLEERHALADEGVRLAEQAGDLRLSLRGRALRLIDVLERGDVEQARLEIELFAGLAQTLRSPVYLAVTAVMRTTVASMTGRFADAERLVQEVFAWGERITGLSTTQAAWAQALLLRRERGGLVDLLPLMEGLVQEHAEVPAWRAGLSFMHVEAGNLAEARRQFDILAGDGFEGLPRDGAWLTAMATLAEVCDALRDPDRAAQLYRLLLPFEKRNTMLGFTTPVNSYGAAARYLGVLASVQGRWEEAEGHFQDGEGMNERMGAVSWLARTRHDHAKMLLARGRPGDLPRARRLLDQARAVADELGMVELVERVEALPRG